MGQSQSTQHQPQAFDAVQPLQFGSHSATYEALHAQVTPLGSIETKHFAAPKKGCCGGKEEQYLGRTVTQGRDVQSNLVSLETKLKVTEEEKERSRNQLQKEGELRRKAQESATERLNESQARLLEARKDNATLVNEKQALKQDLEAVAAKLSEASAQLVADQAALEQMEANIRAKKNAEEAYYQLQSDHQAQTAQFQRAQQELSETYAALTAATKEKKALSLEKEQLLDNVEELKKLLVQRAEELQKAENAIKHAPVSTTVAVQQTVVKEIVPGTLEEAPRLSN